MAARRNDEEEAQKLLASAATDDELAMLSTNITSNSIRDIIQFPTTWADTEFMNKREWWMNRPDKPGGELDYYLETSPFESYVMYLGHISSTRLGRRKKTLREVGILKAVIRVCMTHPAYDE
eukprot:gene10337-13269_t